MTEDQKTHIKAALDRGTVTLAQIAIICAMSHAIAWNWVKKHDFPKPKGSAKNNRGTLTLLYPAIESISWLIKYNKLDPVPGIDPNFYLDDVQKPEVKTTITPQIDNKLAFFFITGGVPCLRSYTGPINTQWKPNPIRLKGDW